MQYINVKHSKGANVCPMIMSVDAHEKQNLKSAFCYKPDSKYYMKVVLLDAPPLIKSSRGRKS